MLDTVPPQRTPRARHANEAPNNVLKITICTILGALIPGVAHLIAGRRYTGMALLTVTLGLPLTALAVLYFGNGLNTAITVSTNPQLLLAVAFAAVLGWLAWSLTIIDGHFALRQGEVSRHHRALLTSLVVLLTTGLALPTYAVANTAMLQRSLVNTVFASDTAAPPTASPEVAVQDPWRNVGRVNIMLLGSDAGVGRKGTRPDTIMVASVDTKSGNTVLLSLPRNLQYARFRPGSPGAKAWPRGFRYGDEPFINGIWSWADDNPKLFPNAKNPGLAATQSAVEQTLGLDVHYWATVNLAGFEDLINAIGGVTINVPKKIAIAKSDAKVVNEWIMPGRQQLDGHQALWFGRSRWKSDDYSRMRRQRCLIGAVTKQADPLTVAKAFPKLAVSARRNVQTSIPARHIDAFVQLSRRVQKGQLSSVAFTNQVIDSSDPDFTKIRRLTREALANSAAQTPAAQPAVTVTPSLSPSVTASRSTGTDAGTDADTDSDSDDRNSSPSKRTQAAESLDEVCSY